MLPLMLAIILCIIGITLLMGGSSFKNITTQPRLTGGVLVAVSVILLIASMVVVIPAGNIGVPVLFGKVQDHVLTEGLNFVNPLLTIEKMSVRTQAYTMSVISREGQRSGDDSITVLSKDGLRMPLDITVQYRMVGSDAPAIYRTLGLDYIEKVIRPAARTAIREAASQFTAQEAYSTKRGALGATTQEILEASIEKLMKKQINFKGKGFIIQQVLLRNVSLPKRLETAIEEKLSAEQEAQRMEFVLAKERKEAERKKIEGEGIATFQKIVSEGISEQLLRWKGIEATLKIAESKNSKVIVIGGGKDGLPVILNTEK